MENKTEKEKKVEQMVNDRTGENLFKFIIAKTFARHASMTEEEFLKDIGYENSGKTEKEATTIAIANLIIETMYELIRAKDSFKLSKNTLKIILDEKSKENKE